MWRSRMIPPSCSALLRQGRFANRYFDCCALPSDKPLKPNVKAESERALPRRTTLDFKLGRIWALSIAQPHSCRRMLL